jgi:hypothetical protein
VAVSYLLTYAVLRLSVAWSAAVWGLGDRVVAKKLWLVPLRDAIGVGVWITGFFTDQVHWRGLKYRVRRRLLEPVRDAAARGIAEPEHDARATK